MVNYYDLSYSHQVSNDPAICKADYLDHSVKGFSMILEAADGVVHMFFIIALTPAGGVTLIVEDISMFRGSPFVKTITEED